MSHTPRSRRTRRVWSITLTLAMVAAFLPLGFNAQAAGNKALQLNGTSQYATVGTNTSLRFTQFTLETWFNWTGGGDFADTGIEGIDDVIPLIAKGTRRTKTRSPTSTTSSGSTTRATRWRLTSRSVSMAPGRRG